MIKGGKCNHERGAIAMTASKEREQMTRTASERERKKIK